MSVRGKKEGSIKGFVVDKHPKPHAGQRKPGAALSRPRSASERKSSTTSFASCVGTGGRLPNNIGTKKGGQWLPPRPERRGAAANL